MPLNPRASRFGSASTPHDANGVYRGKITLIYEDNRLRVFINALGIAVGPLRVADRASSSQFQVNDEVLVSYLDNQMSEMVVIGRLTERQGGFSPTITDAENGELLEYDGSGWVNAVRPSGEPIGFEDRTSSSISFDNSTRTFQISASASSYIVWCAGVRHVKSSSETVVIPNTTGLYYIYFSSAGTLSYKTTYFTWSEDTPVSYVYWNATTASAEFFADERHGVTLDWATHEYLHRTRGAAIAEGLNAYGYTLANGGDADSDAQISITDGSFFDEDLEIEIAHSSSPTANSWEQRLDSPAYIPIMYRSGVEWVLDTATEYPVKLGSSLATYNFSSSGSWSTPDMPSGKFGTTWIIATNNLNEPIIGILGQGQDDNIGQAEERNWTDLDLTGLPIFEFRPLYKVVYETNSTYTNSVKTDIVAIYDIRSSDGAQIVVASAPLSSLTDVALGAVSQDDVLVYDGSVWTNSDSISVASLSVGGVGISTSGATSGNVLSFDGTNFVPGTSAGGSSIPAGTVVAWAGTDTNPPTGWLFCDGTDKNRTTYSDLFDAVGTQYGTGDGSTTFGLPNLTGRVPIGYDSADTDFNTLGNEGGVKEVSLSQANLPTHTHPLSSHTHPLNSHTHSYPHTHPLNSHTHPVSVGNGGSHSHTTSVYQGFNYPSPSSITSNGLTSLWIMGMRPVATTVGTSQPISTQPDHNHPSSVGAAPGSTGSESPANTAGPSQTNSGASSPTSSGDGSGTFTASAFETLPQYTILRYIIKT